jgi:hypothetical protein
MQECIYDFPKIHSSPLLDVSLVMNSLPCESHAKLTLLNVRIVEDVFCRSRACQRLNRRVLPVFTELEAHSDELETRDRGAVPRAVVRNVHGARVGIELAVDGRRVREERELGSGSFLFAGIVVESAVGCLHEEVTDIEFLVGEV